MGFDIDAPNPLPVRIRSVFISVDRNSRVGAEKINLAVGLSHLLHQMDDIGFIGNIGSDGKPADFCCDSLGFIGFDVGDDDGLCARLCKPLTERAPDAKRASGDDNDFVFNLHIFLVPAWRLFPDALRLARRPSARYVDAPTNWQDGSPDTRLRRRALRENRFDDASEDVIRHRWQVYTDETRPVLNFYAPEKIERVDAMGSPAKVIHDILGRMMGWGLIK